MQAGGFTIIRSNLNILHAYPFQALFELSCTIFRWFTIVQMFAIVMHCSSSVAICVYYTSSNWFSDHDLISMQIHLLPPWFDSPPLSEQRLGNPVFAALSLKGKFNLHPSYVENRRNDLISQTAPHGPAGGAACIEWWAGWLVSGSEAPAGWLATTRSKRPLGGPGPPAWGVSTPQSPTS